MDGWVQHDDTIFPGTTFTPYSDRGGNQFKMTIKYQLFENNWWLACQGRWIGFYPARLFMGNQSVFSTLGDHADHIGFWGEIFDSDDVDGRTQVRHGQRELAGLRLDVVRIHAQPARPNESDGRHEPTTTDPRSCSAATRTCTTSKTISTVTVAGVATSISAAPVLVSGVPGFRFLAQARDLPPNEVP